MIITRAPLRISLGGGGTDLPSYARKFDGMTISAAIDKYVFLSVHETFEPGIILKYSKLENVKTVDEVQHPIIREALKMMKIKDPHLEITSHADIPAGTGLGSSSSFAVALLKALAVHGHHNHYGPNQIADQACEIEINRLHEPIGRQDQYISAYGGIQHIFYCGNEETDMTVAERLILDPETLYNLEDGLLLFFTGYSRSASAILKVQDEASKSDNSEMLDNLHMVKALGEEIEKALLDGDLEEFAALMDAHWEYKKHRAVGMSNAQIDEWYAFAKHHGALGGKLVGAGGGGFLMLYTQDSVRLRHAMGNIGLKELHFKFDWEGVKVVSQ